MSYPLRPAEHMPETNRTRFLRWFDAFATRISRLTGAYMAFIAAGIFVIAWAVTGPLFHFSEGWQMIINTSTTIITFLMLFIIQRSGSKDTMALQLKINELIAAERIASNRLICSEDLTENELRLLKKFYKEISLNAKKDQDLKQSHSIEEAIENEKAKEALQK